MSDLPARIGKLRVRDLLLLEYVHELGTLQKVAERLNVTQPAVTLALQVLEDAFGVPLVQRGRRGVTLTATGEAILSRITVGRKELSAAYAMAVEPQAPHLRLGCSPVASMKILPLALARFFEDPPHAKVRISLVESSVPALWAQLNAGDLDAIVCRMPNAGQFELMMPGMMFETVGTERMVLVAARDSTLGNGPLDMAALAAGQAWVLPPKDSLAYVMLTEWFVRAGFLPPVATITSASFQTSLLLVASARMVTLAPESTARALADALGLKIIETESAWGQILMVFAYRASSLHLRELLALKACFSATREEV
ncbi:MAG: LysR family transcriptional regulator [Pseudomonadota bacterium]